VINRGRQQAAALFAMNDLIAVEDVAAKSRPLCATMVRVGNDSRFRRICGVKGAFSRSSTTMLALS
jgi:hypothetical protein